MVKVTGAINKHENNKTQVDLPVWNHLRWQSSVIFKAVRKESREKNWFLKQAYSQRSAASAFLRAALA